ncbi:dihydrolipoamide succinyltransferase [Pelobium manganitolerans]|uniref:Dihydrolipoyllysine-residue succinyltransferase component of 2-oxoglutarate dehydrogenase complex n=1 Tax=Pelobium manganitolerans TaxID=1842495 RepID=A0A419S7J6_9SPHI|nr:2-oxoglutarate dehydrogenase complex dihydrolipoyllysine-residue succinyltransferase [Pelobium manganitolerans]RKD17219.1 dihydrolipoamide succinyltransferase [Pelobium manganitolerans]
MSLEMKVPAVGESIIEVILSKWLKQDGEQVEMDEVIAELESDKATFELTAESAGTLKHLAQEGDTLEIGQAVCSIEEGGTAGTKSEKPEAESEETAPEPANSDAAESAETTIKVPAVGESITEVTLTKWLKQDGEAVELDEVIAELESDKATFELPAEAAGILHTVANEGDALEIGAVVATISGGAGKAKSEKPKQENTESAKAEKSGSSYADKSPSPAAAKILAEKGIDPKSVNSTGVDGRITKADALNAQKPATSQAKTEKTASTTSGSTSTAAVATAGARDERREKMTSLRKTISKRLVTVKNETAMLTTFNEVNMAPIMELRKKYKDSFKEKHGVGLGFMSFFTKAVTEALKDFPAVGARIEGEELVYSNFADVSIAVSAPKGLVVPVIRNAESMSMAEIEKEVVRLAIRAREGKLGIDEMTGGTFTITNGGIFGSMLSTPIINAPQSAILGMHNIVERPVAENGQVVIRPMMYLALSYDHRVIDGRESVSFLVKVKQLLEDPARLLLGI